MVWFKSLVTTVRITVLIRLLWNYDLCISLSEFYLHLSLQNLTNFGETFQKWKLHNKKQGIIFGKLFFTHKKKQQRIVSVFAMSSPFLHSVTVVCKRMFLFTYTHKTCVGETFYLFLYPVIVSTKGTIQLKCLKFCRYFVLLIIRSWLAV